MLGAIAIKISLQSNEVDAACVYTILGCYKCYERAGAGLQSLGFGFGGSRNQDTARDAGVCVKAI